MKFEEARLENIFSKINSSQIAVIGDLMLDRYIWGVVDRISPEAPVLIVNQMGETSNLGGAANVAANVSSLGAQVTLIGLVGNDPDGLLLRQIVKNNQIDDERVVVDPGRPTSVKTRVIAHNQHVVRIDRENTVSPTHDIENQLIENIIHSLDSCNGVILEDYNKGVLTERVIQQVISACKERKILVGVDPKKENFWSYKGATFFKPNLKELEIAVGTRLEDDSSLSVAGREVFRKMELDFLLVTRGEKGMALFTAESTEFIPTRAHRVHDVSGAGDTVIATVVTALVGGADIFEAVSLANNAASIVIAEIGAIPVDAAELRRVSVGR